MVGNDRNDFCCSASDQTQGLIHARKISTTELHPDLNSETFITQIYLPRPFPPMLLQQLQCLLGIKILQSWYFTYIYLGLDSQVLKYFLSCSEHRGSTVGAVSHITFLAMEWVGIICTTGFRHGFVLSRCKHWGWALA